MQEVFVVSLVDGAVRVLRWTSKRFSCSTKDNFYFVAPSLSRVGKEL